MNNGNIIIRRSNYYSTIHYLLFVLLLVIDFTIITLVESSTSIQWNIPSMSSSSPSLKRRQIHNNKQEEEEKIIPFNTIDTIIKNKEKDDGNIVKRRRSSSSDIQKKLHFTMQGAIPCNLYNLKSRQQEQKRCEQLRHHDNTNAIIVYSSSSKSDNGSTIAEQEIKSGSAWPPWPFNLVSNNKNNNQNPEQQQHQKHRNKLAYKSTAILIYHYLKEKSSKSVQQIQQLTNAASFHLPPSTIPLVLFSILPISNDNPLSYPIHVWTKRISCIALSVAILSWAEYVTNKKRLPSSIFIDGVGDDIVDLVLPPFLPEFVPPPLLHTTTNTPPSNTNSLPPSTNTTTSDITNHATKSKIQKILQSSQQIQSIQKTFNKISKKSKSTYQITLSKIDKLRSNRSTKQKYLHRVMIQQELLALQQLKKNKNSKNKQVNNSYAMVVGASHGLGRALCIELARYSIPLILISRNETQLEQLSSDIQQCYGIPCHTIIADLNSSPTTKCEEIFQTTIKNQWNVDYFIYNSGICHRKDITALEDNQVIQMLNVNMISMTMLSKYYAASMKQRRKGRMVFISSIVGSLPSAPTVGIYAATKSYMTSYAHALAHELSSFGVSVTCCKPGAIKETSFQTAASSSSAGGNGNENALCWKIPFYPKTPQEIAHRTITPIVQNNQYIDAEIIPGWQNRFLKNVVQLFVSKRVMNIITERCWNTWNFNRDLNDSTTFLNNGDTIPHDFLTFDNKFQQKPSLFSKVIRLDDGKLQQLKANTITKKEEEGDVEVKSETLEKDMENNNNITSSSSIITTIE